MFCMNAYTLVGAKWSAAIQATAGWAALTPAERRVALLIGTGHTNKSASTKLGVSVNTVGSVLAP
jgi:DNA-binding CsgD family transcriptional regulator